MSARCRTPNCPCHSPAKEEQKEAVEGWEKQLDEIDANYPMALENWDVDDWRKYIKNLLASERASLAQSNEVLRSAMEITKRRGAQTNWEIWEKCLAKELERQHKIMYPDQYLRDASGGEKKWGNMSDFFHNATEEEKREVMLDVAREATNDQRKQIGLEPLPEGETNN